MTASKVNGYFLAGRGGVLASLFALSTHLAGASGLSPNVSQKLELLRGTVVSAEVWLVPRRKMMRYDATEQNLAETACSYRIRERQDLESLLNILVNAQIAEGGARDDHLSVGIAIYLRTSSEIIALVTTPEYKNAPTGGMYNGSIPVVLKNGFEDEMWKWASQRQSDSPLRKCHK